MLGLMYNPLLTVELDEESLRVTPWIVKATLVVVALTPLTLPSSSKRPVERLVAVVHLATRPLLPAPVRPLPAAAKVICPAVDVVMVTFVPATRLVGAYLTPVPSAANSCPVTEGAVEVAVPPLLTPRTPETSLLPKAIAPLYRAPAFVDLTGRAEVREEMVVEPLVATDRKEAPEVEATVKIGKVWAEEEAWTTKEAWGVVELMPKLWEEFNQTKLLLPAVVLAAVA
jgi:hypothetical protein